MIENDNNINKTNEEDNRTGYNPKQPQYISKPNEKVIALENGVGEMRMKYT